MSSLVFDSKGKPRRYLSVTKVAAILGVSRRTIERWIEKGKVEAYLPFANSKRIPVEEVERLLRKNTLSNPSK